MTDHPDVALGGDHAPFTVEENVLKILDVVLAERGGPALQFLDHHGNTVPW